MNLTFSDAEFESIQAAIGENLRANGVSPIYFHEWSATYGQTDFVPEDGESIEKRILAKALESKKSDLNLDEGKKSIYTYIKSEIHKLLCGDSKEYAQERKGALESFNKVVLLVSTAVAARFGLEVGLVTGVISLILLGAYKIGRNAWCKFYSDNES
ncbi:hypothetical protein [Cohnella soli]|uniref:Uncharacterized protein n=1 Tax=Cohnella soli TaxID=425005 RepID=A0ABW0HKJ1_9BACL